MRAPRDLLRAVGFRRAHVAAARMRVERHLLPAINRSSTRRPRILAYHSVGTPSWGVNDVQPKQFRRQVELALEHGYRFVPAEDIARGRGEPGDLAITFDDGVTSVVSNAAPFLAEHQIPWALFVVTGWAGGNHPFGDDIVLDWHELQILADDPLITIGSHSESHPRLAKVSPEQAWHELAESRRMLQDKLGRAVDQFALPHGRSDDCIEQYTTLAYELGYEIVYAQAEDTRPVATVPRTFITRYDNDRIYLAALRGAFDRWDEWV